MDPKQKVAAAVAAGYLLGRTKKLKLAITVGSVLAGQRLSSNPQKLLKGATSLVQNNPALSALQTELRGRAFDAAKGAAVSVATSRIDKLTDTLRTRGEKKRAEKEAPAESEEAAEEPEDQYEEGAEEEPEDQYEEAGEEGAEEEPEDQYVEAGEEGAEEEPEDEYEEAGEEEEPEDQYEEGQPEEEEEQPEPAQARAVTQPAKKVAAKKAAPAKKVASATAKKVAAKRPSAQKSGGTRAGR